MKVWAQVGQDGGPAAELLCNSPRLQRAQPNAEVRYRPADSLHQVNQGRAVFQVLAPGGDLDASEHDLLVARCRQGSGLAYGFVQRQGADRSPGIGDNAVGAEVDTSVLHFQIGSGAALHIARMEHLKAPPPEGLIHRHGGVPGLVNPLFLGDLLQLVQKGHAASRT